MGHQQRVTFANFVHRWSAAACTFRGYRLRILLDDEETGEEIACLEGSQSYRPTVSPDTLTIFGKKEALADPNWIKVIVASGLATAWQCRRDLNNGITHAAAC